MENLAKIGIDLWGVVVYMGTYGILLLVLGKVLLPKIKEVIENRKKTIQSNIEAAEHLKAQLTEQLKKNDEEKKALMKTIQEEKVALAKEIEEKKVLMISEMESTREKMLAEARSQIESEKNALMRDVEEDVVKMIQRVVLHILSNQVSEDVIKNSVVSAWKSQSK